MSSPNTKARIHTWQTSSKSQYISDGILSLGYGFTLPGWKIWYIMVFFFDPAFRSKLSWDYQQWACCIRCVRMVVPLFWCLGGDIYARARQQVQVRALVCRLRHYFPWTITSIIYALWTVRVHTHRTTLYPCTPGIVDVTRNWQKGILMYYILHQML